MKNIQLTKGQFTIVDDEDYDWLSQWKWYISRTGYAHRNETGLDGKQKTIRMHRQIIDASFGEVVDHINHNKLDNRKSNLRICNDRENQQNSVVRPTNKLGVKGVCLYSNRDYPIYTRFISQIQVNGKKFRLGYFENIREAVDAYNQAAIRYFGEFACLSELSDEKEKQLNKMLTNIINSYTGDSQ